MRDDKRDGAAGRQIDPLTLILDRFQRADREKLALGHFACFDQDVLLYYIAMVESRAHMDFYGLIRRRPFYWLRFHDGSNFAFQVRGLTVIPYQPRCDCTPAVLEFLHALHLVLLPGLESRPGIRKAIPPAWFEAAERLYGRAS